jgi:hypothetical protein
MWFPSRLSRERRYEGEGLLTGLSLEMRITPRGANRYGFRAEGHGARLGGIVAPVSLELTIGDDSGTPTAGLPAG